tara:strand:+ start:106 stop:459 length:354 start_codon:yes stop_codon:yes gene_type:complete
MEISVCCVCVVGGGVYTSQHGNSDFMGIHFSGPIFGAESKNGLHFYPTRQKIAQWMLQNPKKWSKMTILLFFDDLRPLLRHSVTCWAKMKVIFGFSAKNWPRKMYSHKITISKLQCC